MALLRIVQKEVLQLRRDQKMLPLLIAAPLIQILVFGFAANQDVNDIPMLLVDRDRTAASRALVDRFTGSGHFRLSGVENEVEAIEPWLVDGRAQVALVVGEKFGADLAASRTPRVQVIADGTDSTSAVVGLQYASRILSGMGLELAQSRSGAQRALVAARPGSIDLVPRVWFNPDLKSRWFYLPAILAMVLMLTAMILPSMAVVREKEIGTLEQLIVTPIRPWELIVGKLFPYAVIGLLNVAMITALITIFFGVPLAGSGATLIVLTLPFLLALLASGLLVSTVARNQQQAMMMSMFAIMVPMIYLSGLIFPIENMPPVLQKVTYAIPLRYYANILRGVFLRGSGFDILWTDAAALTAFALGILTVASLRFRKTLD